MKDFIFFIIFCFGIINSASAAKIIVVDGDSLEIDGKRIRLEGIDAPEYNQECYTGNGKLYKCGLESKKYLETIINQGKVSCDEKDIDRYQRSLCICYVINKSGDKLNVNEQMIRSGWAVMYRNEYSDYYSAEAEAKKKKKGIWQGKFMKPQLYRILNK